MRLGVILSGCGFQDGAEIHETVLTRLALSRAGAAAVCFAPHRDQAKVVNHLPGGFGAARHLSHFAVAGSRSTVDLEACVLSTPACMPGPEIMDVAAGIERRVAEVLKLAQPAAAGA